LLRGRDLLVEVDREEAAVRVLAVEQGAKNGIAIDARPGCPDDPATPINKGRHVAVADDSEVESGHESSVSARW
jgi:hypothetical protein